MTNHPSLAGEFSGGSLGLVIVDVQNDFCEGGVLGVSGGSNLAAKISDYVRNNHDLFSIIVASRDWHDALSDNGGHFALGGESADYRNTWPEHCIAGSWGSHYCPRLETRFVTHHLKKGQGAPGYSAFEGLDDSGYGLDWIIRDSRVERLVLVGIALEHCVSATAQDAVERGLEVLIISNLTASIDSRKARDAEKRLSKQGVRFVPHTVEPK